MKDFFTKWNFRLTNNPNPCACSALIMPGKNEQTLWISKVLAWLCQILLILTVAHLQGTRLPCVL